MREIKEAVVESPHFTKGTATVAPEEGTREMFPLYPFVISGGENTEWYYFRHINSNTKYKFNIRPEYFGKESQFAEVFPEIVDEILRKNADAVIFCVFDMDTVVGNPARMKTYQKFEKKMKGKAELCPSMPSIEYWFLLHFEDCCDYMNNWRAISNRLAPYIRHCFPDSDGVGLKKLLKKKKYLENGQWVKELCKDGKLDNAIERAEKNYQSAKTSDDLKGHSYTRVYQIFKTWEESFEVIGVQ